jgi:penicillin-binding protein 2
MEAAVENGTARFAQIPGIRVAGKTGTAQVRAQGGTLHLAWFIGYAPADDPRVAIAVMLEGTELADNYAGGTTAAPVAREIMLQYFDKHPINRMENSRL